MRNDARKGRRTMFKLDPGDIADLPMPTGLHGGAPGGDQMFDVLADFIIGIAIVVYETNPPHG
jgi:hypothetical protein